MFKNGSKRGETAKSRSLKVCNGQRESDGDLWDLLGSVSRFRVTCKYRILMISFAAEPFIMFCYKLPLRSEVLYWEVFIFRSLALLAGQHFFIQFQLCSWGVTASDPNSSHKCTGFASSDSSRGGYAIS